MKYVSRHSFFAFMVTSIINSAHAEQYSCPSEIVTDQNGELTDYWITTLENSEQGNYYGLVGKELHNVIAELYPVSGRQNAGYFLGMHEYSNEKNTHIFNVYFLSNKTNNQDNPMYIKEFLIERNIWTAPKQCTLRAVQVSPFHPANQGAPDYTTEAGAR